MNALKNLSRRVRLALHRHDRIECRCEVTEADCYPNGVRRFCVYCSVEQGQPHISWCKQAVTR